MIVLRNIIFIFLDGVGVGEDQPETNPFARFDLPGFTRLAGGQRMLKPSEVVTRESHVFRPIDATLGVEGLPQSGTGQATIFTGVNCAELAGKHYGPYPHSSSRETIRELNIFTRLQRSGLARAEELAFANVYPKRFFDYVEKTSRWTATTRCCLAANILIRSTQYLENGLGLAADLTGTGLKTIEDSVVPISEEEAASNLIKLSSTYKFTLFEYFHTDKAGHAQSFKKAQARLSALDLFFSALLDEIDASETLLIVTSDHGNIEDLSTKSHTFNPVPFVALGLNANHFESITDLSQIADRIESWYDV